MVCEIDLDHRLHVTKTRCRGLDRRVIDAPGEELGETLRGWLTEGAEMPPHLRRPDEATTRSVREAARAVGPEAVEALDMAWVRLMRTQADAEVTLERILTKACEKDTAKESETGGGDATPVAEPTGDVEERRRAQQAYFATIREVAPPDVAEEARWAFQKSSQKLPDSTTDWTTEQFRAITAWLREDLGRARHTLSKALGRPVPSPGTPAQGPSTPEDDQLLARVGAEEVFS